ncbi:MAG: 7-cyano-7-deazaguanine synthase QueC [Methanocellales archaeon]
MKAFVLLSSGLDSTVAFKKAYDEFEEVRCLTFDYGQKARMRELEYSKKICSLFKVKHSIIKLPWLAKFKGSLTQASKKLPMLKEEDLDIEAKVEEASSQVWVPARNAVFLSIAASYCENFEFDAIVAGFDREEAVAFPDNSMQFISSFNAMLKYGTRRHVEVIAPLIEMNKAEIAALGIAIKAPLEWSWSCYTSKSLPCGKCESCVRRKRAFKAIGIKDPLLIRLGVEKP